MKIRRSLSSSIPLSSLPRRRADRRDGRGGGSSTATSLSLAAPVAARRTRSAARFFAVVISHAPGLRGTPSRCQRSSCRREGVLCAFLGEVPVTREADQRRHHPAPLVEWKASVTAARHISPVGYISQIGLTSIAPCRAAGIFDATSIASSRSLQSQM